MESRTMYRCYRVVAYLQGNVAYRDPQGDVEQYGSVSDEREKCLQ